MNLIITHDHGDFDALAALVAAGKLYPDSAAVLPEPVRDNVRHFVQLHREVLPLKNLDELDAVPRVAVVVDTRRRSRLGPSLALVQQATEIHIFDHHPPDPDDLEGDEVRVEPVGAVTTLLVEEIRRRRLSLTDLEASLLALGIYEDTACLTHAATTSRDLAAAAFLWEQGVNAALLREHLAPPLSNPEKTVLEKLVAGSAYYEIRGQRVLVSGVSLDDYISGVSGLLRYLQEIEEAALAVALVQTGRGVHLAARSISDELDLTVLLAPLGAEGQRGAVTAFCEAAELPRVREKLLELLEHYLPPAVTAHDLASFPEFSAGGDLTVDQVMELLEEKGLNCCPVTEEGRLAGTITRQELQKALRNKFGSLPVRRFMRRQAPAAAPGDSLAVLRRKMVEGNTACLPLADETGEPAGIVTCLDILRSFYRLEQRGKAAPGKGQLIRPQGAAGPAGMEDLLPLMKDRLPVRLQSLLLLIGQRAEKAGAQVFLVGGFVRDLLLGRPAPGDLDLMIIPDAVAFARELPPLLGGKLKVFEQFGTATLFLDEGLRLDLATARQEFYTVPGAPPEVEETSSLKKDLYRRDFTINTMACSIMPLSFGRLYDFFGGRVDLERGVIRALYHLSFADDPLRILRAARFERRFGFSIEENTLELIHKAVRGGELEKVSRQRLGREASLIYGEPDPVGILKRLGEFGALAVLYPRLHPDEQTWRRLELIGEALEWAARREWKREPDPELVYLAGLLYDLENGERSAIMRRLYFSRERTERVLNACRAVPLLLDELTRAEMRHSVLVNRLEPLPVEAILLLYALAPGAILRSYLELYLDSLQFVRPRLGGAELKELGVEEGPLYSEVLNKLRAAILDGRVRTPEEEKEFILVYLEQGKER